MVHRVLKPLTPIILAMLVLTKSAFGFARMPGPLRYAHRQRSIHNSVVYSADQTKEEPQSVWTPWNHPALAERMISKRASRKNKNRCRQHVNPLASQFQKQTALPVDWPNSAFKDSTKPLHIDIGCGKGGFLLDFATASLTRDSDGSVSQQLNHLGLEIRPQVVELAKSRMGDLQGHVDFIGCNVNVDLDRILSLYPGPLQLVSIQFPDPHFKTQHAKRRVVTPELVHCIARHLQTDGTVFLQSDIQSVLDDMRLRFAEDEEHFVDCYPGQYIPNNPLGVPTEREASVLERDLPIFRAMFRRNGKELVTSPDNGPNA